MLNMVNLYAMATQHVDLVEDLHILYLIFGCGSNALATIMDSHTYRHIPNTPAELHFTPESLVANESQSIYTWHSMPWLQR